MGNNEQQTRADNQQILKYLHAQILRFKYSRQSTVHGPLDEENPSLFNIVVDFLLLTKSAQLK